MFVCRAVCAPRDPAADTVKIDMDTHVRKAEQEEADHQAADELEARIQFELAEDARRRAREEEERAAEEARLVEEEAARTAAEEEQRRQREEAQRAEKARREREAAEEAKRHEEDSRQKLEQERKEAVTAFLKQHKFKSPTTAKKTMLSTTYAIHTAAMCGDEQMVKMLIEEGADPELKNSSGKTAAQVAKKKDAKGSHAGVLRVLGGA